MAVTVSELIAELQKMPPDLPVFVPDGGGSYCKPWPTEEPVRNVLIDPREAPIPRHPYYSGPAVVL